MKMCMSDGNFWVNPTSTFFFKNPKYLKKFHLSYKKNLLNKNYYTYNCGKNSRHFPIHALFFSWVFRFFLLFYSTQLTKIIFRLHFKFHSYNTSRAKGRHSAGVLRLAQCQVHFHCNQITCASSLKHDCNVSLIQKQTGTLFIYPLNSSPGGL